MSYESPIEIITSQMRISIEQAISGEVVKAVQKVGINVDKAELLRALAYDRGQYDKGYADGKAARHEKSEPIRMHYKEDKYRDVYLCPTCKDNGLNYEQKYCAECGQAIEWEGGEKE